MIVSSPKQDRGTFVRILMRVSTLLLTLAFLAACRHDPSAPVIEPDCPGGLSYVVDILPIVNRSCNMGGCHAGAYDTYEGIEPKIAAGTFVDRVFTRHGDPVLGMPPAPATYPYIVFDTLSTADRELLRCWVRQGFPR